MAAAQVSSVYSSCFSLAISSPSSITFCKDVYKRQVASFAFGARDEDRFHQSVRFALKASLLLTVLVAVVYILLSRPLILLFNQNPVIVDYGRWLLVSQVALYPAFGLCYICLLYTSIPRAIAGRESVTRLIHSSCMDRKGA